MKPYIITRDNDKDLKFIGFKLGFATTEQTSNNGGNWTNFHLWETKGKQYVCQREDVTLWEGGHNEYKVKICKSLDEVIVFFGQSRIAKELYHDAGIDNLEEIN